MDHDIEQAGDFDCCDPARDHDKAAADPVPAEAVEAAARFLANAMGFTEPTHLDREQARDLLAAAAPLIVAAQQEEIDRQINRVHERDRVIMQRTQWGGRLQAEVDRLTAERDALIAEIAKAIMAEATSDDNDERFQALQDATAVVRRFKRAAPAGGGTSGGER